MSLAIIRKIVLQDFSTKCLAVLIGYSLWHITSQMLTVEKTCTVPIAFYNTGTKKIVAQEEITVTLKGKRGTLDAVTQHLALHIDASKLSPEQTDILLHKEDLFLPDTVQLVHYTPTHSFITVVS